MACIDGIDPSDFESGILDPGDVVAPDGTALSISYDDTTDDFFAAGYVQFEVNASPIDYINAVEFDFSTSNGSATAGTHYTARTGVHVVIPAGTGLYVGQINVLKSPSFHGDKTLTVTISNPVNATIAVSSAVLTIHYEPVTKPTDPAKLDHFNAWPEKITVYNQFSDGNPAACTAYATTAATSAHEYLDTGRKVRFDADRLWDDDGHITDLLTAMHRAVNNGVWTADGSRTRKMRAYSEIDGSSKSDLIERIKRNIYRYGPVGMVSIWFTQFHAGNGTSFDWNTAGASNPHNILPVPSEHSNPKSCLGHATIIVGWDNNIAGTGVGGFLIQSSHGSGWGHSGRAWMPYKTFVTQRFRDTSGSTCNAGTGGPTGYVISNPWFRFYRMELKRGG